MRSSSILAAALVLSACFSKPPDNTGGDGIDPGAPALIAAGTKHGCRITAGQVLCWGDNGHGQLGMRVDVPDFDGHPGLASHDTGWTSIATGAEHSCGVRDGAVYCWGDNTLGQSDPNGSHNQNIPSARVALPGESVAERVFAGGSATCALTTTRDAYCWGDIELDRTQGPTSPRRLGAAGDTFKLIAIADDHACAIADGGGGTPGVVHCWGLANAQQTGRNDHVTLTFGQVAPIASTDLFNTLSSGHQATCGTTTEGKLVCWGSSNEGQLADTSESSDGNGPIAIDDGPGWTTAAVGELHTCAVRDGDVYCFGEDMSGALGDGKFTYRRMLPSTMVAVDMKVAQLAANSGFTCALGTDGVTMKCWGSNSKGELGNKKYSRKYDPTEVALPPAAEARQIVAGNHHACALVGPNLPAPAYCWGLNSDRQIGSTSNQILHAAPVMVGSYTFTLLAAGGLHTCGITSSPAIMACWGDNVSHQLGTANGANMTTVMAPAGTTWRSVAAGSRMTCGITDTDRLLCWGVRAGTTNAIAMPTDYPPPDVGYQWKSISIGSDFAVAVALASGQPRVYGFAISSKLCAANLPSNQSNPQTPTEIFTGLIPSSLTFPKVAAAQNNGAHTCLLRRTTPAGPPILTCFGDSQNGRTGGSTTCVGTSPTTTDVMLPVAGTWSDPSSSGQSIFTASDQSCALDGNGQIWCWGLNSNFELGRMFPGPTPDLINDKTWTEIAGGFDHTCGIESMTEKVFCWGENQYGQVGDSTSYEPSPVVSGVP